MTEPTFDRDGYPTDETLDAITNWPSNTKDEVNQVIPFIASAWHYPEMAKETRPGLWVFATGGWSGNEDLIHSLRQHRYAGLTLAWNSLHLPGGLHVYALTKDAEKELDGLFETITTWAWKS